jgi:hypothetical protein
MEQHGADCNREKLWNHRNSGPAAAASFSHYFCRNKTGVLKSLDLRSPKPEQLSTTPLGGAEVGLVQ